MSKPEWQDWTDERCWVDPRRHGGFWPEARKALERRKYDCGVALAGIRNPAAVREVVEAATEYQSVTKAGPAGARGRLLDALAALDQPPEET